MGQIKSYETFEDLYQQELSNTSNDEALVVNFWATWCVPCVKELPLFNELPKTIGAKKVKILLVSLDLDDNTKRLEKFIQKKKIKPQVILLKDTDYNRWVNKISSNWEASIPATFYKYQNKTQFYEGEYHSINEIKSTIQTL